MQKNVRKLYVFGQIVVIPAGFEPTACRLGEQEGVRLGLPSKRRKALVLLGF